MKKFFSSLLVGVMCVAALAGCGAKTPSGEELIGMNAIGDNARVRMELPLDMSMSMMGMDMSMKMNMDMTMDITPETQYIDAVMSAEMMGEKQDQAIEMYLDMKNKEAYMNMLDNAWYSMSLEEALAQGDYASMSNVSSNPADYADIEVSEEGEEYIVKATLQKNKLAELLDSTGEMATEDEQMIADALADVRCETVMHYDKKTKVLKKAIVSMLDPMEMKETEEGMEVGMTINPFTMTIEVLQIGDVTVEIPQEVIDSAQPYEDYMADDFGGFGDMDGE